MKIQFEKNIQSVWGETGQAWLENLPKLCRDLLECWELEPKKPFENLTYSYVLPVIYQESKVILKLSPPGERVSREILWYKEQNGRGCPALLLHDEEKGALLLERVSPGTSCKSLVQENKDKEATKALAEVIKKLNPMPSLEKKFPHIREFLKPLAGLEGLVPEELLSEAVQSLDKLTAESTEDVLLHGDLHQDNILKAQSGWVAIDPHGYRGPRGFEVGAMMRNPHDAFPKENLQKTLTERVKTLSENLPFSPLEIITWSLIYTMIASTWSLKDHGGVPEDHTHICQVLQSLKKSFP